MEEHNLSFTVKNKHIMFLLPMALLLADYIAILAAEYISFGLRNFFISNTELRLSCLSIYVIIPVVYIAFMQTHELYTRRTQFWRIISEIFNVNLYAIGTLVLIMYLAQTAAQTSRLFVGLMWIFSFIFLVLGRYIIKKILNRIRILQVPVLIMGAGKTASLVLEYLRKDAGLGYDFIGFLEDHVPAENVAAMMPKLGNFSDAEHIIKNTGVPYVLVIAPGLKNNEIQDIIYRIQPLVKKVSFIPDMGKMPLATLDVESLIDGHIVTLSFRNNLAQWYNCFLKRFFDLVCTVLGIIFLSPVLAAIAIWIYMDSPGPVIFKHRRVGRGGKEFWCYKFRSMCADADVKLKELLEKNPKAREEWEREFKLKDDPRITKSGDFLRKTSLDELPQLFNVLKGDMSLVGPRPIIRDEIPRYGRFIDDFYMVRPGITGMWQTSGRSDVSYDERVQMDTWYVRNWNVWFDIVLIWRTIGVVLGKKGAY